MSNNGNQPNQNMRINDDQIEGSTMDDDMSVTNQQNNRNILKRTKKADDSFEFEYRHSSSERQRKVNVPTKYFNNSEHRQSTANAARRIPQQSNDSTPRPTFPPFKISFKDGIAPSELSIIKDINRQCQISISFGRYSSFGSKKSFLLYANSSDQFDRLSVIKTWPEKICNLEYVLNQPTKIPTAYSIVVRGVPAQWCIEDFANDIKKQYCTIAKVERMFIKGGKPISKVRIDFSSSKELTSIMKNKRILFDDANTSYQIEPYVAPTRILRCFNCQQYNDHTALNCPNKDKPICFRCGLGHPYNPNCLNKICSIHCNLEHMAGSPSCSHKIEERSKRNEEIKMKNVRQQQQNLAPPSVWNAKSYEHISSIYLPVATMDANESGNVMTIADISKKLDLLMAKVDDLAKEQSKTNKIVNKLNLNMYSCRKEIDSIRDFVFDTVSPYLYELGETFMRKCKLPEKDSFRTLHSQFKEKLDDQKQTVSIVSQSNIPSSTTTTLNESDC